MVSSVDTMVNDFITQNFHGLQRENPESPTADDPRTRATMLRGGDKSVNKCLRKSFTSCII